MPIPVDNVELAMFYECLRAANRARYIAQLTGDPYWHATAEQHVRFALAWLSFNEKPGAC